MRRWQHEAAAYRQAESLSPPAAAEESMSPETQWQVAGSAAENYETYLVP